MNDERIEATVEDGADGLQVKAPAVGWWSRHPRAGDLLVGGSPVGLLQSLHRRRVVVLPSGATGRVSGPPDDRHVVGVEYGQLLFRLEPVDAATGLSAAAAAASDDTLQRGALAVRAPSDGVFYRRPSPAAAAYVEVGQRIHRGQTVGLVEVMKTFNQIVFDGPGGPDEARVVELRAEDGDEVQAGQLLLVLEP